MSPQDTEPLDGDVDRGPILLAVTIVSTSLALIVVALRMFVRIKIVKNVGWDDHTIVAASLLAIVVMIFEILSVTHGIGRHMYYLSPTSIPLASKWSRATTPPNLAACALARISVCLFFMRILSRGDRKKTLIFLWALIALNISVNIVSIVGMLVRCRPIEKLWDHNVPGVCGPASTSVVTSLVQGVVSVGTDWVIALFPVVVLRGLNMAVKTKVVLGVLMGMGVFAGAAALKKMMHLNSLAVRPDVTWDVVDLTCWSIVEQNVGIIAVSIPAIRPLFSRVFKIGNSSGGTPGADHGRSYDLGVMAGRKKGPFFPGSTALSGGSASGKGKTADGGGDTGSGSELSLVRELEGRGGKDGIGKTVSVPSQSRGFEGQQRRGDDLGVKGRDRERDVDVETGSWFRE